MDLCALICLQWVFNLDRTQPHPLAPQSSFCNYEYTLRHPNPHFRISLQENWLIREIYVELIHDHKNRIRIFHLIDNSHPDYLRMMSYPGWLCFPTNWSYVRYDSQSSGSTNQNRLWIPKLTKNQTCSDQEPSKPNWLRGGPDWINIQKNDQSHCW